MATGGHEFGAYHETQQPTREEVVGAFLDADRERNRRLREGMRNTRFAPEGELTTRERLILGLTGSLEELKKQNSRAEQVRNAHGEPLLALWDRGGGYLGLIDGELQGEFVNQETYGQLYIPLRRVVHWNRYAPERFDEVWKLPVSHVHYRDSDPIMGMSVAETEEVRYDVREEFSTLLIGYDDVLGCEDVRQYSQQIRSVLSGEANP